MKIEVRVLSSVTGNVQPVMLDSPATVREAISKAGMSADNATIRVNNQPCPSLDKTLGEGDMISITQANLKAAQRLTFEELLSLKNTTPDADLDVVNQAASERLDAKKKEVVQYYASLLAASERVEYVEDKAVSDLGIALNKARQSHAKVKYCIDELKSGRPCPFIALTGRKSEASVIFQELGIHVPENDSDCWCTTPPKDA